MINPFISNNEQFLFRKNYHVIQRPTSPTPTPLVSSNDQLTHLQHRSPFNSVSPKLPLRNTSFTSPQRPNSLSRSNVSSYKLQYLPRGGLLQTADGWKKDVESREREKFSIYGAEGLRYNAYVPEDPLMAYQKGQSNEYYDMSRPVHVRSPSQKGNYDSISNYYMSPRDVIPKKEEKGRKELFQDEIYESPNFNVIDPRKDSLMDMIGSKNSGRSSRNSRHSEVNDMFQSEFDERLKKSMQYGSLYGGNGTIEAQMVDSRHYRAKGSRFRESGAKFRDSGYSPGGRASMESSVHRLEVTAFAPSTINFEGQIYHRILL